MLFSCIVWVGVIARNNIPGVLRCVLFSRCLLARLSLCMCDVRGVRKCAICVCPASSLWARCQTWCGPVTIAQRSFRPARLMLSKCKWRLMAKVFLGRWSESLSRQANCQTCWNWWRVHSTSALPFRRSWSCTPDQVALQPQRPSSEGFFFCLIF